MKKLAMCVWACMFAFSVAMTDNGKPVKNLYQFSVDLTRVKNDKITVELVEPDMNKKEVVYYMPKIVPGTYANYNFGRFVTDFTARDRKGKVLPVEKLDENSWKIKDANKLSRISYTVEDTWDTDQ